MLAIKMLFLFTGTIITSSASLEWLSFEIKVITPTNHTSRKQSIEPIRARIPVAGAKRGKTRTGKSQLLLAPCFGKWPEIFQPIIKAG